MHNFNIQVIDPPSRRTLRVNVRTATGTISIKDVAVDIGLDRTQALALTQAAEHLDNLNHASSAENPPAP